MPNRDLHQERHRGFGSAGGDSSSSRARQRNDVVLSWRRLLLSRAKLKATSRTSALLSGFAMVAMVEIQLSDRYSDCAQSLRSLGNQTIFSSPDCSNKSSYDALLVSFSIVTTLLIATHTFALLISTCILPNLEAVTSVSGFGVDISDSPHDMFHWYIETAWICSTGFGIILFLVEIGLLCWIKFFHTPTSAIAATVILIPLVFVFAIFAFEFYRRLVSHKEATVKGKVEELDDMNRKLKELEDGNIPLDGADGAFSSFVGVGRRLNEEDRVSVASGGSDTAAAGGVIY